ncbi:MAG: aminoacyl-tRNA hydrolase [bacterium]|nr:aminoacyl-tRNA hydrolase [bacterium]
MKMIVGLGNPGEKYKNTRHNVGFLVLDELARHFGATFKLEKKFEAEILKTTLTGEEVLLVKPMAFMNLSGSVVRDLVNFYKIDLSDVWVIYDDIDLPLGEIRVRKEGRSGGHKGLESIIEELKTDQISRIKIGIGRPDDEREAEDYVLESFENDELPIIKTVISKVGELVLVALEQDNLDSKSISII